MLIRRLAFAFCLLACAPLVRAGDPEFEKLATEADTAKQMKAGIAVLKKYFKKDADVDKGELKAISARDKYMRLFMEWLDKTEKTMGVDLRGKPNVVVEIFDRARVDIVAKTKAKQGKIDYTKVKNQPGLERLEYALLLPQTYKAKNDARYPLVVSLHARVIDPRHPAFRGKKPLAERGRVAIHDGWLKTPAADSVAVIAPTGTPNGFRFTEKSHQDDLHVMFVTMGQGLTNFRTDWNRVFLEVYGSAVRVACEHPLLFAGFILRDREDERSLKIPEEELFMFENLNGAPLIYVADNKTWKKVGKPMSEAMAAAYKKAGKLQNFILMRDNRDANGALKGDTKKIAEFVTKHRLPPKREAFQWRYFNPDMRSPLPVEILLANYFYDSNASLSAKAGALKYSVKIEKDKDSFVNIVNIEITEAESLLLYLYDGPFNLNFPVTVIINGVTIHNKVTVKRDWGIFTSMILPRRFFMMPIVASLECKFNLKPQFEKKKAPAKKVVKDDGKDSTK